MTTPGSLSVNPFPSGTGLSGSDTWNSSNGIGQLVSSTIDTGLHGFIRGGYWSNGGYTGVLALYLSNGPSSTFSYIGFRVSR